MKDKDIRCLFVKTYFLWFYVTPLYNMNQSLLNKAENNEKKIICLYEGEHIYPKCLNCDQVLIVQCGFIVIYLEDEFGKKKIIDFKIPGENLQMKFKNDEDKIHQLQGKMLEYTEILIL